MKLKPFLKWGISLFVLCFVGFNFYTTYTTLQRAIKNSSHWSCQSNLKQIGLGLLQYQQDYDERLPPAAAGKGTTVKAPYGWVNALWPYTKSHPLFYCPEASTKHSQDPTQRNYTDYWFNFCLFGASYERFPDPSTIIMSGDGNDGADSTDARYSIGEIPFQWRIDTNLVAYRHLDGLNLLFADGHVKWFDVKNLNSSGPPHNTFTIPRPKPKPRGTQHTKQHSIYPSIRPSLASLNQRASRVPSKGSQL